MEKIDLIKSKYTILMPLNLFESNLELSERYKCISIISNDAPVFIICVCVCIDNWDAFIEEQHQNLDIEARKEAQNEKERLNEACETILKTDPFGGKYSGFKLIDIFKANILWVDKAINEMHNKYIVDRLKIISKGVNDGKIDI